MEEQCWDDEVDPRIKGELERLNNASRQINLLEKHHEDAQELFRQTLAESASHLKSLSDKLGKKVDQARPYYETLNQTEQVHNESEQAAARYERACDNYNAAKDMVKKAEQKLQQDERFLDSACQQMLNHATMKVMAANQEKIVAERIHLEVSQAFNEMQEKKTGLQKSLKTVIHKTRAYFELKERYNKMLEAHKRKVFKLQNDIILAKNEYHAALRNLEVISDSIHERRSSEMNLLEPRGQGVGAENPEKICLVDSPRTTDRRITTEVNTELECAIKSLRLQDTGQSRDCMPDGRPFDGGSLGREPSSCPGLKDDRGEDGDVSFGEISFSSSDNDNEDDNDIGALCELVTPPSLREGSTVMEAKLFVSPIDNSDDEDVSDTTAIRLEKWFFFSQVPDKHTEASGMADT